MLKRLGHQIIVAIALTAILSTLFKFNAAAVTEGTVFGAQPFGKEHFSKNTGSDIPGLIYSQFVDESESGEEDSEEDSDDFLDSYLSFAQPCEYHLYAHAVQSSEQSATGSICCEKKRDSYPAEFVLLENFRL